MLGTIIQARMGSSRLPGKVMMKVNNDDTVLSFLAKQLSYSKHMKKIVIATTEQEGDDIIARSAKDMGIECFRGNRLDVLDRYYQCAKKFNFSTIIRITADCPLIDPHIVDLVIEKFKDSGYDYVTNSLIRTYPYGTEVEIFSFNTLETAWNNAKKLSEREHVTPYIYNNKHIFRIFNIEYPRNISHLSWTVDRSNDLKLVQSIILKIDKRPILLEDILDLIKKEPDLTDINKDRIPNEGYLKSLVEDKSD
jgi:spore coat polysaccharide biosynthesis protein SpsF